MNGHTDSGPNAVLGDGTLIGSQRGVTRDLEPGAKVWGTPARPVARPRLPELLWAHRRQEEMDELRDRIPRRELRELE